MYNGFSSINLDESNCLWFGELPIVLIPDNDQFFRLWNLHPDIFHTVKILGKSVETPRWQQAYNKSYSYTGSRNNALPVPPELSTYWDWAVANIDPRLNGLLLNWYDGALGHYIGKHRDSTENMIKGAPIVTLSFGEERVFRIRPWKKAEGYKDFAVQNGSVIILPYETNQTWTHEIVKSKKYIGKRISLTLRAFKQLL